jgi:hypothetical protein
VQRRPAAVGRAKAFRNLGVDLNPRGYMKAGANCYAIWLGKIFQG